MKSAYYVHYLNYGFFYEFKIKFCFQADKMTQAQQFIHFENQNEIRSYCNEAVQTNKIFIFF